ncbi:MAG: hypothetical protein AABX93_02945 [Nanoarchaeota archaeon]
MRYLTAFASGLIFATAFACANPQVPNYKDRKILSTNLVSEKNEDGILRIDTVDNYDLIDSDSNPGQDGLRDFIVHNMSCFKEGRLIGKYKLSEYDTLREIMLVYDLNGQLERKIDGNKNIASFVLKEILIKEFGLENKCPREPKANA